MINMTLFCYGQISRSLQSVNNHFRLAATARRASEQSLSTGRQPRHRQHGLSLVELMVALVISTLIMIGLVQIFSSTRATYQVDEGIARLQENARFAMDFLARDIRMAGNMGCLGGIPPDELQRKATTYVDSSSAAFDLSRGIEGFDFTGTAPGDTYASPTLYPVTVTSNTSPTLNAQILTAASPGSDVLVLRLMDAEGVSLVPPYNDSAQVFVGQPNNLQSGQILIVTDCDRVSIFQATTVSNGGSGSTNVAHAVGGSPGNICPNWGVGGCPGKSYKAGAQIAAFRVMAYYIGRGAYGGPSLYRRTWDNGGPTDTELVEGIENMQILYGVDTDQDKPTTAPWFNADRYAPASAIPVNATTGLVDWSRVVSVRVSLLASGRISATATGETVTIESDAATYNVGGVTINPQDDRRQRRVFTTTVELRNR